MITPNYFETLGLYKNLESYHSEDKNSVESDKELSYLHVIHHIYTIFIVSTVLNILHHIYVLYKYVGYDTIIS